jgi:rsbT antagonist protein RsbS
METSTIQKLEDMLLVSVPRDLMDDEVLHLRRQVGLDLRRYRSRWVLLDFGTVDICDSFFGRFIQSMARMAKLMGAEVILSGLQDAVVETLVDLGLLMDDIHAALDLDDALALSRTLKAAAPPRPDVWDDLPDVAPLPTAAATAEPVPGEAADE